MASKTITFEVEVTVRVDARMVKSDYGVPGSPVWMQPEDMVVDGKLDIDGVDVRFSDLPDSLTVMFRERAMEYADSDFCEWEE